MQTSNEKKKLHSLIQLNGKCAIVTGGAQGIGEAISLRFAEAGAAVMIVDINEEKSKKVVEKIVSLGGKASFVHANITKLEDIQLAIQKTIQTFNRIDILVNNAGIYPFSLFLDVTPEEWQKVQDLNVTAVFHFTQGVAKWMIDNGVRGSIINLSSVAGLKPAQGLSSYCVSKAGLKMLTKVVALELSPQIRVNSIHPGVILTDELMLATQKVVATDSKEGSVNELLKGLVDKIPLGRTGTPDDIARMALFLASDLSEWMTGTKIICDGGSLLSKL